MRQKVQFIATIVSQPELAILDEPFTGLDPLNTEVLKDAILELQKQGTTVALSTHNMSMAENADSDQILKSIIEKTSMSLL